MIDGVERAELPEQVFNFRDLGGLPIADGGQVRSGVLFRSATPQLLSESDVVLFTERLGIRRILDLRFSEESESEGHGLLSSSSIEIHNLPFLAPRPADAATAVPDRSAAAMAPFYVSMVELSMEPIARGVRLLVGDGLPALFHCAAGKDRTGMFAAVVLSTIGVPDTAIIADYVRTNEATEQILSQLTSLAYYADREHLKNPDRNKVDGEVIRVMLERMRERFGSTRGYLLEAGISDAELERLKELLVAAS